MDLDKLTESIEQLLKKHHQSEVKLNDAKQRESELLKTNEILQRQINEAQAKIRHIIEKLKSVEEPA